MNFILYDTVLTYARTFCIGIEKNYPFKSCAELQKFLIVFCILKYNYYLQNVCVSLRNISDSEPCNIVCHYHPQNSILHT